MLNREMTTDEIVQTLTDAYKADCGSRGFVISGMGFRHFVVKNMSREFSNNEMDMTVILGISILFPHIGEVTYRIRNTSDANGETEVLYWSNEDGWGDKDNATIFTVEERYSFNLPIGGRHDSIEWVFA